MEELYAGMRLACEAHHVDIVGGDTTSSLTGLAISITAIGDAPKDKVVYRNGAKETDLICVSGNLGAAYMGLQLLEREKSVFMGDSSVQPDFAGKEYLLERQLKPEARRDIISALAEAGIALYGGCSGDADAAVTDLLAGTLRFNPNVRCDHHDHHGEGHNCADHHCGGNCH